MFDDDATDISRAYAAARTLAEPCRQVWRGHLRRALGTSDLRTIVDLGCGVGRFPLLLRDLFHARVYGIDPGAATDRRGSGWAESHRLCRACGDPHGLDAPADLRRRVRSRSQRAQTLWPPGGSRAAGGESHRHVPVSSSRICAAPEIWPL